MSEDVQLERYRSYVKARKKFFAQKSKYSSAAVMNSRAPYAFIEAWWLLGDPGNPLLGHVSLEFIRKYAAPETFEKVLEEVVLYSKVAAKDLKRKLNTLAFSHNSLAKVMAHLERDTGFKDSIFNLNFVAPATAIFEEPLAVSQLPLSYNTSKFLRMLNVTESADISVLSSLRWRDLGSVGADLSVGFELLHLLEDWLGQARWNGVIAPYGSDLDRLAQALSLELNYRAGRGHEIEKYGDLLVTRNGWGVPKLTLDQFGERLSVTRERIRQIERTFVLVGTETFRSVPKSVGLLSEYSYATSSGHTLEQIRKDKLIASTNWTLESIASLMSFYIGEISAEEWLNKAMPSAQDIQDKSAKSKAVRDARSLIGIISLTAVKDPESNGYLPKSEVKELICNLYARSFFDSDLALVSTAKGSSGLENSVSKQLAVSSPLHFEVLQEGISRSARRRGANATLPSPQQVVRLLSQTEHFTVDSNGYVSGKADPVAETSVEGWILQQLLTAPNSLKSKAEIYRSAISENMNLASITQYLSYSPMFRLSGDGLVYPVGSPPTQEALDFAYTIANNLAVKGDFKLRVLDSTTIEADVQLGTNFMISGVISLPTQASKLLANQPRSVHCCEKDNFDITSKVTGSFWYGFSGLRDHLFVDHGLKEASWVTLRITSDNVRVIGGTG
jgi:hypothetical protein